MRDPGKDETPHAPAFDPATAIVTGPALRILYWAGWPDGFRPYLPGERETVAWLVETGMITPITRNPWRPHAAHSTAYRATDFGLEVLRRSYREI